MTGRRRLAVAGLAVIAAGSAGLGVAAGGAGGDASPAPAALAWAQPPQVVTVPGLPSDRVLVGRVRNASGSELRLEAETVRIVRSDGSALRGTARFAAGFGHALYSPSDAPAEVAADEQRRLGVVVTLAPGATAPLTLSWRLEPGTAPPSAVRAGGAELALPAGR